MTTKCEHGRPTTRKAKSLRLVVVTVAAVSTSSCSFLMETAIHNLGGGSDSGWVDQRSEYYQKRGVDPDEARGAARWDFRAVTGRFPDD